MSGRPLLVEQDQHVSVEIRLSAQGIPLDPLVVTARRGFEPGRFGFARRRAQGKGVCLRRDSIGLREPGVATDAFHAVPGIVVRGTRVSSMYGCLVVYADHVGVPVRSINLQYDYDWIEGIEIYKKWDEVPDELKSGLRILALDRSLPLRPRLDLDEGGMVNGPARAERIEVRAARVALAPAERQCWLLRVPYRGSSRTINESRTTSGKAPIIRIPFRNIVGVASTPSLVASW